MCNSKYVRALYLECSLYLRTASILTRNFDLKEHQHLPVHLVSRKTFNNHSPTVPYFALIKRDISNYY